MTEFVLAAAFVVVCYTVMVSIMDGGLPTSLSSSVFALDREWKWLFGAVMFCCGVLIGITIIDKAEENFKFLGFLVTVGMGIVAVTPLFKKDMLAAHYVGAFLAGGSATLVVALHNPICLCVWVPYIIYILASSTCTRKVLWAEAAAFASAIWWCLM